MHTQLTDYDFSYPPELVAQYPSRERGGSRLMVCQSKTGEFHHTTFRNILDFLKPHDCLVFNDTRVIPARLIGKKETGGRVEIFLLSSLSNNRWKCLGQGIRQNQFPSKVILSEDLYGMIHEGEAGTQVIDFFTNGSLNVLLRKLGRIPLPPYILRDDHDGSLDAGLDQLRYQTIFSKKEGAIAAPTAGLHWTDDLLREAKHKKIEIAFITLHVGIGTFLPIRTQNIVDHQMHSEYVEMTKDAQQKIHRARRVIAVGTTVVRALESWEGSFARSLLSQKAGRPDDFSSHSFWTDLFIAPGYAFKCIHALQTNFHQPKSTLLVMVSSFAGRDNVMKWYQEAIDQKYSLFSYGDTMLIL